MTTVPHPRQTSVLYGHDQVEREILSAIHQARLSHAWLISGQAGIGKATLGYRLARYLLTDSHSDSLFVDPNDTVFRLVENQSHPDLMTIEGKERRVSVDEVREVVSFLRQTPALSRWRVVLIDGAESLNWHGQNALLKNLEEPPDNVLLMLIAERPSYLLPTVRSRCRKTYLTPLSQDVLRQLFASFLPQTDPDPLIPLCGGSFGRAVTLHQTSALSLFHEFETLCDTLPLLEWKQALGWIDRLIKSNKQEIPLVQELILGWMARSAQNHGVEPWADLWAQTLDRFSYAQSIHLDPYQTFLDLFTTLISATKNNHA